MSDLLLTSTILTLAAFLSLSIYIFTIRIPLTKIRTTLSIQNKLALYALAIDTQDWDALDQIFTSDVVADYRIPGHDALHGLPAVKSFVVKQLTGAVVQHTVNTIVLEPPHQKTGNIKSTSYVVGNTLGQGKLLGEAAFVYGVFRDTWTKSGSEWKVKARVFELFPPGVTGNPAVLKVENY